MSQTDSRVTYVKGRARLVHCSAELGVWALVNNLTSHGVALCESHSLRSLFPSAPIACHTPSLRRSARCSVVTRHSWQPILPGAAVCMGHDDAWSIPLVSVVNGGGGITRFSKTVSGCSLLRCPVGSHSGQRGNFPLMSRQQWSYYIHVRVCVCVAGDVHA